MNAQSASPVFQVSSLDLALRHYIDVLGFTEDFRYGDYAGVKLGGVCLHLSGHSVHERPIGGGMAYVFCDEVDSYYEQLTDRGATVKAAPRDYDYGMRDFVVVDIDGNHIGFGCATRPG